MKLIYADEAFRVLSDYYHHRTETQAYALREALDRVPEAVVRCDKCRWHYDLGRDIMCAISKEAVRSDDYCSYGERRADETECGLTEADFHELRDRFGEYVEFVVRDMVSGKEERWERRNDAD